MLGTWYSVPSMFESLSDRFNGIFTKLRGKGRLKEADVDATLVVQLIETSTGASLWSSSASASKNVGQLSVFEGGDFVFGAEDPEDAYGDLVNALVAQVTNDFRARWERRVVP